MLLNDYLGFVPSKSSSRGNGKYKDFVPNMEQILKILTCLIGSGLIEPGETRILKHSINGNGMKIAKYYSFAFYHLLEILGKEGFSIIEKEWETSVKCGDNPIFLIIFNKSLELDELLERYDILEGKWGDCYFLTALNTDFTDGLLWRTVYFAIEFIPNKRCLFPIKDIREEITLKFNNFMKKIEEITYFPCELNYFVGNL